MNVVTDYETEGPIEIAVFFSKIVHCAKYDHEEDTWQAWAWVECNRFHERKENGEPIECLIPVIEPIGSNKIHGDIFFVVSELISFVLFSSHLSSISYDFTCA